MSVKHEPVSLSFRDRTRARGMRTLWRLASHARRVLASPRTVALALALSMGAVALAQVVPVDQTGTITQAHPTLAPQNVAGYTTCWASAIGSFNGSVGVYSASSSSGPWSAITNGTLSGPGTIPVPLPASTPLYVQLQGSSWQGGAANAWLHCDEAGLSTGANTYTGSQTLAATGTATSSTNYGSYSSCWNTSYWTGTAAATNQWCGFAASSGEYWMQLNGSTAWYAGNGYLNVSGNIQASNIFQGNTLTALPGNNLELNSNATVPGGAVNLNYNAGSNNAGGFLVWDGGTSNYARLKANELVFTYGGSSCAQDYNVTNASAETFGCDVYATVFHGSGAGLSAGTIPDAALVTPPACPTAGTNITVTGSYPCTINATASTQTFPQAQATTAPVQTIGATTVSLNSVSLTLASGHTYFVTVTNSAMLYWTAAANVYAELCIEGPTAGTPATGMLANEATNCTPGSGNSLFASADFRAGTTTSFTWGASPSAIYRATYSGTGASITWGCMAYGSNAAVTMGQEECSASAVPLT